MSLSGILGGAKALGGTALSWAGTFKYWLISIGVVAVGAFGYGYFLGNDHVVTKVINASNEQLLKAQDSAAKAQKDQDDKDWAANRADYEQRHKQDLDRARALEADIARLQRLIPKDPKCVVPAEAMKALNDPAVVGRVAQ